MDFSQAPHSKRYVPIDSLRVALDSVAMVHPSFDADYKVKFDGVPMRHFVWGSILLLFFLFGRVLSVISFVLLSTECFLIITASVCAFEYWLYDPKPLGSGVICARPMTKLQDNIASSLVHFASYKPPWWYFGAQSTTLLPTILYKPLPKQVVTQPVIASDGSTLFLEWYVPADTVTEIRGVILAIAGMNGSSDGGYMIDLMERMGKEGYAVAILTGRGAGKSKIEKIEAAFHLGRSEDLLSALDGIETVTQKLVPMYILGFSAGGIRAVKFASVYGETLVGRVAGVISFGGAVKNEKTLSMNLSRFVYQPVMVHAYACTLYSKLLPLLDNTPHGSLVKEMFTSHGFDSFRDYDKNVTARMNNITVEEYHALSMPFAAGLWQSISVPTLIVNACDDPVLHVEDAIVPEMAMRNSFITLLSTTKGGHIGWPTDESNGYKWMMDVAHTYISQLDKSS